MLTAEQRATLARSVQQMRQAGDQRDPNRPQRIAGEADRPAMAAMGEADAMSDQARSRAVARGEASNSAATASRFVGRIKAAASEADALPLDLELLRPTKAAVPLKALLAENRPTVIVLGSWSAPSFRDRTADLPWLVDNLRTPGGRSADLVVAYTRERHPAGEWQTPRNEADGISIAAHATADDRVAAAAAARTAVPDRVGVSFVLDSMDDALLEAIGGGDDEGDWAVVVTPDGTVSAKQRWFDPTAIPGLVAEAREAMREDRP